MNFFFQSYDAGDYFPIWGTCFGFEILTMITAGKDLRTATKAIDISYPLILSKGKLKPLNATGLLTPYMIG